MTIKNHPTPINCRTLHCLENDTKAIAFCGPTAIAAITGQPFSVVRNACRMARHGANWPARLQRAPNVRGVSNKVLEEALRILGYVGRWENVDGNPTLAAWLDNRTAELRRNPCVVNVTGHYVTVAGYEFVDTFTKGVVVDIDEAPRRRKRVKRVFIVTGQVPPTPVVSKQPAVKTPLARARSRYYSDFVKYTRSVGATYRKQRGGDELEIRLKNGCRLFITHTLLPDDWANAQNQLEDFLSAPTPDPERFDRRSNGDWDALYI